MEHNVISINAKRSKHRRRQDVKCLAEDFGYTLYDTTMKNHFIELVSVRGSDEIEKNALPPYSRACNHCTGLPHVVHFIPRFIRLTA